MVDHFAHQRRDFLLFQLEHLGQTGDAQGIVERSVREEIRPQSLLLNLLLEHRFDALAIGQQLPDLNPDDELPRSLPLPCRQRFGGLHDVIPRILRRARENLAFVVLEHAAVGL